MTIRRVASKRTRIRPGILLLSVFLAAACLCVASVGTRLRALSAEAFEKSKPGSHAPAARDGVGARLNESYGKLPLSFEANRGQLARGVSFAARGNGYGVYLKPAELALALRRDAPRTASPGEPAAEDASAKPAAVAVLSLRLVNANARGAFEGLEETPAKVNYLVGDDPRGWRAGVPTYAKVRYRDAYPGVDVVYYGNQRQLEYDFVVAPGRDPRRIRLAVGGASAVRVDADGSLLMSTAAGDVRQHKPFAYQEARGGRREVAAVYKVRGSEVSFELGAYDRSLPLVIDPVLVYSSYLGGGSNDTGLGVAVDAAGSAYVCGTTASTNFPGPSPLQGAKAEGSDAFILKLSPDGKSLVYATYLGGNSTDTANSVAVDAAGNAYVAGNTVSTNFPTSAGAFQPSNDGGIDGFLTKLNPAGSALVYSTYLGGDGFDHIFSVAVDAAGAAHVAGRTDSLNFTQLPTQTRAGHPVQRSTDAAATWAASSAGLTAGWATSFAVASSNPNIVYAGSTAGVFKSTDGGANWQPTGGASPSTSPQTAEAVALDPADPNIVYVAVNGSGGLYKSTDGGVTYEVKSSGISLPLVLSVAVNPTTPTTLYAGTFAGIYRSTDGANTWTQLRGGAANNSQRVNRFAIDPTNTQVIYAATSRGVLKTTDGGASWALAVNGLGGNFGAPSVGALVLDPANPSTLYAGSTIPAGVFKSTNGGASWTTSNTGLTETFNGNVFPLGVTALLIDPSTPGTVYAGTNGGGVFKSVDGGANWAAAGSGMTSKFVTALAARPGSPATILAGFNAGGDAFAAKFNPSGTQVEYLRYLGGNENEEGRGIAVGSDGSAYVVGLTVSTNFPAANALQPAPGGGTDAFVAKLSPAGTVAYATHLGGSFFDDAKDVAVGPGGEAYVTGLTASTNFPVANAFQPSMGDVGSEGDAYVTKLAADGQSLVYSTYLGGNSFDQPFGIAVGSDGSAYVAGQTFSTNFPALNLSANTGSFGEAFISKLNPAGSALSFSSAFGGLDNDQANAVAADARGNAYVVGTTASPDFPVVNALKGTYGGGSTDAFVTRIGPDADLSVTNRDSRDPVMVGNPLTYTLTVANAGADDAANVSLSDTLPAGVTFVSATPTQGSCSGTATVTCNLGALASGASATVSLVVTPQAVGVLTNAAAVTSDTPDQNSANNSAQQQTRVSALPSIAGRVTRGDGSGVGAVSMALSGTQTSNTPTAAGGFYSFADLPLGGSYAVTPARQGWVFHPQSRSFADVNSDQTGDFNAVECVFQLTPKNRSFPAAGGTGALTVSAPDALCPWTATSDVPWITVNSGPAGAGTADVSFTVAPTNVPRSGTLRIAGRVFTVWQELSPCDTATFVKAPTYPTTPVPVDIAKGDFNNDGRPDVVLLNEQAGGGLGNRLSVLLGTASGGFEAPRTVPTGGQPRDVAVGDFNNDGKLDAVAVNFSQTNNVQVHLGDGAGNLGAASAFSTGGGNPETVAVGDLNGDGKADILVGYEFSGGVTILLGTGGAQFAAPTQYSGGGTPSFGSKLIIVGDFNKDGKQDIVTTGGSTSFARGNGDGTFAAAVALDPSVGVSVAADFNKDGNLDLAGTTFINDNGNFIPAVAALLGNGAGGFGATAPVPTGGREISRMSVGDFNGDGAPDLGATNGTSGDVNALLGNGAGSFAPGPAYVGGIGPGESVAADFNGDGRDDLVVTDGNLIVDSGAVTLFASAGEGRFVGARSFLATRPQLPANEVVTDDFDGDGRLDLLFFNQFDVTLARGLAPGEFGPPSVVANGSAFTTEFGRRSVSTADFNRDGRPDIAFVSLDTSGTFAQSRLRVFINNGSGVFTNASDALISFVTGMLIRDMNGDGNPDAVFIEGSNKLVLRPGNGQGGFGASSVIFNEFFTNLVRLEAGDFNGDGRGDIALSTSDSSTSQLRVLFGDGLGAFSAPVLVPYDGFVSSMLAQDVNGDGRDDLVTIVGGGVRKVRVMLTNEAGGFTAGADFDAGEDPHRLFLHDLSGDGKPDLVVSNNNTIPSFNSVRVLKGDGAGGFSAPATLATISGPASAAFADFNRDGHVDVALLRVGGSSVGLYLNACPVAQAASTVQFGAAGFNAGEGDGAATVTVTRVGDVSGAASVRYATLDGSASSRTDYTGSVGTLRFAPGEASRSFQVLLTDDALVEGAESLTLILSDAAGASLGAPNSVTLALADNDAAPGGANPIDDARFFVRQHYHDFLNREPDQAGWDFWTENITSCGNDAQCREVKRINVSAAFFLSIEFQETGYLVYRVYKAAYGDATSPGVAGTVPVVRLNEFLPDTQQIGLGVQVGIGDWKTQLENNKQAYALEFVQRPRFLTAYPLTLTAAQFVDKLNQSAGGVLATAERDQLVAQLSAATDVSAGRASALRQVAEHPALVQAELRRAFVLMQYFGYLRRNPDDAPEQNLNYAGWAFWLGKLNEHNGNFVQAEMVKAFLDASEYRNRFGN